MVDLSFIALLLVVSGIGHFAIAYSQNSKRALTVAQILTVIGFVMLICSPAGSLNITTDKSYVCSTCEEQLEMGDKFCSGCGAEFNCESYCPECSEPIEEGDKFCFNC